MRWSSVNMTCTLAITRLRKTVHYIHGQISAIQNEFCTVLFYTLRLHTYTPDVKYGIISWNLYWVSNRISLIILFSLFSLAFFEMWCLLVMSSYVAPRDVLLFLCFFITPFICEWVRLSCIILINERKLISYIINRSSILQSPWD